MHNLHQIRLIAGFIFVGAMMSSTSQAAIAIRTMPECSGMQQLAAKEVARYLYLRMGALPEAINQQGVIIIARKDCDMISDPSVRREAHNLQPQQYLLKTTCVDGKNTWWIIGGDDLGTLYGAYRFAEKLGVRFYLHGDVIPDGRLTAIPRMDEIGKPLFALRGVNPWGVHPFGIDAWGIDDYKAIFTQLAKMRMNFLGIHCYPECHMYPEPTVWHGLTNDFDKHGGVKFSYPSHYFNTLKENNYNSLSKETSEYSFGGSLLFDRDDWAPDVMRGNCPLPSTTEGCNEVFNRAALQFHDAFGFARRLGVKTCLGTEAPLTVPKLLKKRLEAKGKDPNDPDTIREIYEGTFRRIMASHPLDYYWIWTPEPWTWEGDKPGQYEAVVRDIKLAYEALDNVDAPFKLATAGWVLGPKKDRAALDNDVPKDMPISSISRNVGYTELEPAYARIKQREKWAIPWLESDTYHGLAALQLVAGRMRRDAADALAYGCDGLMGLHWRTDILAPQVAALAQAAWDQSGWNPYPGKLIKDKQKRSLPCEDLYVDWAQTNFGQEVSDSISRIFISLDGKVPMSVASGCPSGSLEPDSKPWKEVSKQFRFVDELTALRSKVKGSGNIDRFDYWLNTFRYHRLLAEIRCALGVFEKTMKDVEATSDTAARKKLAESNALPAYKEIVRLYGEIFRTLLATVNTHGGLATVVNLENHRGFWPKAIDKPAERLAVALGGSLPADTIPSKHYQGAPRIIVPTVRTMLTNGEHLRLKIIVLDNQTAQSVKFIWRPMGKGSFHEIPFRHVARAVYEVDLPSPEEDFEYRIEATIHDGTKLKWPATAPDRNHTVLVWKDE